MCLALLGVFGLLARLTSRLGIEAVVGMANYVVTLWLGLLMLLARYLVLLRLLAKRSALEFLRESRELLLLAFSTSSSAAVMPCRSLQPRNGSASTARLRNSSYRSGRRSIRTVPHFTKVSQRRCRQQDHGSLDCPRQRNGGSA